MSRNKQIGRVQLNMEFYKGQDCYTDGTVEDTLLDIAKRCREEELNDMIAEKKDWAVLYHFSHIRQNIVSILDIDQNMTVLEIGAGCGAVTGALAEKAKQVTCVELSEKRSLINAYRNQAHGNVEILVGNFQDIESSLGKYDYITLIGVFEYAAAYIDSESPYSDFLKIVKNHLTETGRVAIAIENKFGLKYFAGCREDHFGTYFEGLEGYSNTSGVRTFGRRELKNLAEDAGLTAMTFYYPYPDYKMATKIYSDDYQPLVGELNTNMQNFDRERMLLFDESKVFNNLIREGLFPECANSFLLIAGTAASGADRLPVVYEKISDDRAEEFSICTRIQKTRQGALEVVKRPVGQKSLAHIQNIEKWSRLLTEQYRQSKISICESVLEGEQVHCPFLTGMTLEEIADLHIQNGEAPKAEKLISAYLQEIRLHNASEPFVMTPAFQEVFGDVQLEGSYRTGKVNNIDMVLNNAVNTPEGWKLIDYEWTFDFPIPVEFIIYRIMHYYLESNNSRNVLRGMDYMQVPPADMDAFAQMEQNFQKYVRGDRHLLRELYRSFGKPAVNVLSLIENSRQMVSVYVDRGAGYSEADKLQIPAFQTGGKFLRIRFAAEEGVVKYRIDPGETACLLKICSLQKDGGTRVAYRAGGTCIAEGVYLFDADPWIEVQVAGTIIREIEMTFCLETEIPESYRVLKKSLTYQEHYEAAMAQNAQLLQQLDAVRGQLTMVSKEREDAMRSISWRITKPLRFVKRGLRKCKQLLKKILKSNRYTYAACKKIKGWIRGTNSTPEIRDVWEITKILCPEDEWKRQRAVQFDRDITFSILVPLYNTPERFLREMIESVQYQTYEKWELCLADGSDSGHRDVEKICREYAARDSRIKYRMLEENKGISGNTNACIDMAAGNYIALFDHDDYLHPSVLYENMEAICKSGADYLYTDEATFSGTNIFNIITRHCKPDFAIDNLRANNYICHFSVFSRELLEKTGKFRSEFDGSQDHDMILRLTENAKKVYHIRKILYYWRSHPLSVAADIGAKTYAIDSAKRAVEEHLQRMGLEAEVESSRAFPTIFRFKYKLTATPKISIVIPNRNHCKDLKKCIGSILEKSTYKNYEIIIVENNSYKSDIFEYYTALERKENIRVVTYEGEFNYSKINNLGVSYATGEFLLLLNNDTEVISPDWMEELLMYAQRRDVAAVGAKLYYPDDTVQHAGIVIGLGQDRAAGHVHYGVDRDNLGYMGKLFYAQDVSAVTGACMMIRTSIYHELGGLDESFAVAFNDVDLCLKAREKGYLNIFTPYCEMYHYESVSRGSEDTDKKKERFRQEVQQFRSKWKKVLEDGDPYYNPNFSLDRADYYIEGQ